MRDVKDRRHLPIHCHEAMTRDRAQASARWAAAAVAFVCALGAVLLTLLPAAALATPAAQDLESLQAQAKQARAAVARLDLASQIAIEKYNVARSELDDLNVRLIETRRDLSRAQLQLDVARSVLGERMADIYKNGGVSVLDVVLGARDFTEIDTQIDYFRQISQADEDTVTGIEALTQRVGKLADQVEKDRAAALTREMGLREKRADVEDQLAQRRTLLADLDARVKELIERQAHLARERRGTVSLDLIGELAHPLGERLDARDGVFVRLADLPEVVDLRVDLGEVPGAQHHVEHAQAAVLVDVGHALAEHRAGHVELELSAREVAARLDEPHVEVVELRARHVVLLDGDLGGEIQARDFGARLLRLGLQRREVLGSGGREGRGGKEREEYRAQRAGKRDRRRGPTRARLCSVSYHGLMTVYRKMSPVLYVAYGAQPCLDTLQSRRPGYTIRCPVTSRGGAVR